MGYGQFRKVLDRSYAVCELPRREEFQCDCGWRRGRPPVLIRPWIRLFAPTFFRQGEHAHSESEEENNVAISDWRTEEVYALEVRIDK